MSVWANRRRAFFWKPAARPECSPRAAAHIGDDAVADVAPSQALGMRAIWLDRLGVEASSISATRISNLHDLEPALSGDAHAETVFERN